MCQSSVYSTEALDPRINKNKNKKIYGGKGRERKK
jgi:hypothetical protein